MGDKSSNQDWPDISEATLRKRQQKTRKVLEEIRKINPDELSSENQLNHRLFLYNYERSVRGQQFDSHLLVFGQRGGIEEEIGLGRNQSELIGYVSPQVSLGTGFIVTPIVSLIPKDFLPTMNKDEVEEIFEVPLNFLLDQNSVQNERRIYDQIEWTVYSYRYFDHLIWGLTAQILRKFSGVIVSGQ